MNTRANRFAKKLSVGMVLGIASCGVIVPAAQAAAAIQPGWGEAAKFSAVRESTAEHIAEKPLEVKTENGVIKISKTTGDTVRITARVRATTQERLDAAKVTATRGADGTLQISVQWPGNTKKPSEGCDLDVQVPNISKLKAETSNGAIEAKNLSGPAVLGSSNGAITAETWEGDVKANTSNGMIIVKDTTGSVDVETSNGRIEAVDVAGPVKAKSSNASVAITLKKASKGPVHVETGNGAVELKVGPAFVGSLHAKTSNGRLTVTAPKAKPVGKPERAEGTWKFGEGGEASEIETDNGAVTVEVKE